MTVIDRWPLYRVAIIAGSTVYIYTTELHLLALRGWGTLYPPEAPFGRLCSHSLIIKEVTSLNMYVLLL